MPIYRRHLRHSSFDRVRHSNNFLDFLNEQAEALAGTGTGTAITFANGTNQVTYTDHGLASGDGPYLLSTDGTLPAELDNATEYWVSVVDTNTLQLHLTEEDALAETNPVAFTDDGTGTHSILRGAEAVDIFLALKGGKTARQIRGLTSIDDL